MKPIKAHHIKTLQLYSDGKTRKQVASALFRGERTIETYLSEIREHFGTKTMIHAIASAMRQGLIK